MRVCGMMHAFRFAGYSTVGMVWAIDAWLREAGGMEGRESISDVGVILASTACGGWEQKMGWKESSKRVAADSSVCSRKDPRIVIVIPSGSAISQSIRHSDVRILGSHLKSILSPLHLVPPPEHRAQALIETGGGGRRMEAAAVSWVG